jgi:hypothetical protein
MLILLLLPYQWMRNVQLHLIRRRIIEEDKEIS